MNARQLRAVKSNVKWKVKAKPFGGKRQALTQNELDRLFAALKGNRHGHRDYMVALMTFLHGLRVSELIDLRWDDLVGAKAPSPSGASRARSTAPTTSSATRPLG